MTFQSTPSGGKATERRGQRGPGIEVSIHAFRGEGDPRCRLALLLTSSFQSTPSGGKATQTTRRPRRAWTFQSTPSGGKATLVLRGMVASYRVSIHAFRGEGDPPESPFGTTAASVSIHAFRGEGDPRLSCARSTSRRFNPRLPGGRRRASSHRLPASPQFQSTPSGGKATPDCPALGLHPGVSIHAFRGEGDPEHGAGRARDACFNPRLPGGRRRFRSSADAALVFVSIHAFRGEGDFTTIPINAFGQVFQSTPSGGKATTGWCTASYQHCGFNPRLPGGRRQQGSTLSSVILGFGNVSPLGYSTRWR